LEPASQSNVTVRIIAHFPASHAPPNNEPQISIFTWGLIGNSHWLVGRFHLGWQTYLYRFPQPFAWPG
jgi:hypothetical protein